MIIVQPKELKHSLHLRARSSDLEVFLKVFGDHEYQLPLRKQPKVILDGGANVGFASVYFAVQFPEARIVAVEPDPGNLAVLLENVRGYPQVMVVQSALWSTDGELELEDPGMDAHAYRVAGLGGRLQPVKFKVSARSVRSLVQEFAPSGFDLVKLDIEGAEREILDSSWLSNVSVLVVELHDRFVAGCSRRFYQSISGFDGDYLFGENTIAFKRGWLPDTLIEKGYWQ